MKTTKVTKQNEINERKTMGLAASQARLLTITARKADCEFESMNLSHQKLALARDMERVSTEYQNSLNQTKLVYDYYGSSDKQTDLTYNLLMSPSIYNDYLPKLVTDPKNRVILNGPYAKAAIAAGIPAEGLDGLPSSDVRDSFIDALAEYGIITKNRADIIKLTPYNNATGVGGGISATTATKELTYDEFMEEIKARCASVGMGGRKYKYGNVDLGEERIGIRDSVGTYTENMAGVQDLSLEMLLDGDTDYLISVFSNEGEELPVRQARCMQEELLASDGFLAWMRDQFATVLGNIPANDAAIQYAYSSVFDLIQPDRKLQDWLDDHSELLNMTDNSKLEEICEPEDEIALNAMKSIGQFYRSTNDHGNESYHTDWAQKAYDYVGFYFTGDYDNSFVYKDRDDRSQISISLSNIAKAFITSYVQFMQGMDESDYYWQKGSVADCRFYNPKKDKDFKFLVSDGAEVDDGESYLMSSFYDTLFNRICINGWTENDNIDDKEYMQELLKTGLAFISSMSDDGFYYQGNYATDRTILEVTDTDAIAQAQAKYNREKAHIEYKEDRIDLKMKNLDTEMSSLTTEYDTTKQLITKTVEKSFKRYEA
jgi:hypothetical protein